MTQGMHQNTEKMPSMLKMQDMERSMPGKIDTTQNMLMRFGMPSLVGSRVTLKIFLPTVK